MGLTPGDVANLNQGFANLQQSLLHKRMLDLEQQKLGIDQARWDATAAHQNRMENRADIANQTAQERTAADSDNQMLHDIIVANTQGQFTDEQLDDINEMLAAHPRFSKIGIQLSKPAVPTKQQTQSSAALSDKWAADLETQADQLEGGQLENDPKIGAQVNWLRQRAQWVRNFGRPQQPQGYTETESKDAAGNVTRVRTPGTGGGATFTPAAPAGGKPAGGPRRLTLDPKTGVYRFQ